MIIKHAISQSSHKTYAPLTQQGAVAAYVLVLAHSCFCVVLSSFDADSDFN